MATVEIVDRSSMVDRLKRGLTIDPRHTAIVTVDMHRGHLDPAVATMPAKPERRINPLGWRLTSSHNPQALQFAVDTNPSTRWTSEITRQPGMWVQVDFGDTRRPRRLELDTDPPLAPESLRLTRSIDGHQWNPVDARWAGPVVWWGKGILRRGNGPSTLSLPGEPARFFRLDLRASSPADPWVISELAFLE